MRSTLALGGEGTEGEAESTERPGRATSGAIPAFPRAFWRTRALTASLTCSLMSVGVTAFSPTLASAQDDLTGAGEAETSESLPVEFHGFVSQGFLYSTGNNYLAKSKSGSFEFNEVGFNVTKVINDRLRTGLQLFARDVGTLGNYTARIDWFYLDYRIADELGFRAGRTKLPFGLYNELSDVDSARVPALLPQSIYSFRNRDYLLAQTGLELYGWASLGGLGALEYRAYLGTIYADLPNNSSTVRVDQFDIPYLVGGRLMWELPIPGVRVGGSVQGLKLNYKFSGPSVTAAMAPMGVASAEIPALLAVASIEYTDDRWLLATELSRWYIDIESNVPALFPNPSTTSERYYVMGSYRATSHFTVGAYYSVLFRDTALFDDPTKNCDRLGFKGCGRQNFQHDVAISLRFDINPYWLVKLEFHQMRGTGDLQPALNDNVQLRDLQKNWSLFIAKTTVHF